jgi:hypothetical protein
MTVKINMEMPSCCQVCRFGRWNEFKEKWACYACNPVKYMSIRNYEKEGRRRFCHLVNTCQHEWDEGYTEGYKQAFKQMNDGNMGVKE